MIRAIPTARATRTMMIIVQIVIAERLLTLATLRSDALLFLRLLFIKAHGGIGIPEPIVSRYSSELEGNVILPHFIACDLITSFSRH